MNETELIDMAREAIMLTMVIGTPVMMVGLIVGVVIALIQALTQIQEMTLAFVPKILGVFFTLILLFPFMLNQMRMLSDTLFDKIVNGG